MCVLYIKRRDFQLIDYINVVFDLLPLRLLTSLLILDTIAYIKLSEFLFRQIIEPFVISPKRCAFVCVQSSP